MNQLYMSSYHLAPDLVPYYLDALRRYRITYICGYTSSIHSLAQAILRHNVTDLKLAVAVTNAEPVLAHHRDAIERAFQCRLRETYGMAEMVATASECEQGALHQWPEVGVIEVLSDEGARPVAPRSVGRLICTGLLNRDMPLIRYAVGDRGAVAPPSASCACGRSLPLLHGLEGRQDDVIITTDGRRVGRLDPVFKADLAVREVQIIQETADRFRIRFVPSEGYSNTHGDAIVSRLRDRVGPVEVVLENVDEIPRAANGKFRAVISHVALNAG